MGGRWIFQKWKNKKEMKSPENFPLQGLHIYQNKEAVSWPIQTLRYTLSCEKGLTVRLYLPEEFPVRDRDIALPSKIKLNAFRPKNDISFLWNRKDGIQLN